MYGALILIAATFAAAGLVLVLRELGSVRRRGSARGRRAIVGWAALAVLGVVMLTWVLLTHPPSLQVVVIRP